MCIYIYIYIYCIYRERERERVPPILQFSYRDFPHRDPGPRLSTLPPNSEGGTMRLETLIELKFLNSSFSSSNL